MLEAPLKLVGGFSLEHIVKAPRLPLGAFSFPMFSIPDFRIQDSGLLNRSHSHSAIVLLITGMMGYSVIPAKAGISRNKTYALFCLGMNVAKKGLTL